jgi:hypothetical protein
MGIYRGYNGIYPLVMTNIAMFFSMAPVEIDGLPCLKIVIFHGYVTNNQMVPGLLGIMMGLGLAMLDFPGCRIGHGQSVYWGL